MRRLAIFAYAFSAAALLSVLCPRLLWLLLPAAVVLLGVGRLFFPNRWVLAILLLGLAVGFVWCGGWELAVTRRAEQLWGEDQQLEAVVLDYARQTDYGVSAELRYQGLRCRLYLDDDPGLEPGQRIACSARVTGTAEKTGEDRLLAQGIPLFAYGKGTVRQLGKAPASWRFAPARLGHRLRGSIQAAADGRTAAFLTAILTGDRAALRADTGFYAMLRRSGIAHCVAISGMHLSFLVSALYILLGRGRLSSLVCMPVILLFMAVTGFTPSVVRAGVMQLAVCLSGLLRREADSHTSLALSLLFLTALNPYCIKQTGLQLSFASTLGILLFCTPIQEALPHASRALEQHPVAGRLLRFVRGSLAVSLSALVLTTPLTALCFRQVSLLAPLSNLLTLGAVTLCFQLGLGAAVLGLVWPLGARLLVLPVQLLVRYVARVTAALGSIPLSCMGENAPLSWLTLGLLYLLLLYFRFCPGLTRRFARFCLTAGLTLLFGTGLQLLFFSGSALTTTVLDVGQGQCVVLTGRELTMVADCGGSSGDNAGDTAAAYLLDHGRSSIDILLLSHFHADHANGAAELLERLPISLLVVPPFPAGDPLGEEITAAARRLGTEVCTVAAELLELTVGGVRVTVVPPLGIPGDNEQGLCALVSLGSYDVLLTGDASQQTERLLLKQLPMPDIEVMTAGHHGSRTAVSQVLLDTAAPDVVVISVGRNHYGLPAPDTTARIQSAGARLYRTDETGTVSITYKGKEQNG